MILEAGIALVGVLLLSRLRRASAAPAPSAPGGTEGSTSPVGGGSSSMARVWTQWANTLERFPGPMPVPALLAYTTHEVRGRPSIVVRNAIGEGGRGGEQTAEIGLFGVTAGRKPSGEYYGEAVACNVDPLDPVSNLFCAQRSWQAHMERITGELAERGFDIPPPTAVGTWATLLWLPRSIGGGGVRKVMDAIRALLPGERDINVGLRKLAEGPERDVPFAGRQSREIVQRRIRHALDWPTDGARVTGGWPSSITPALPRPDDIKPWTPEVGRRVFP